MLVFHFSVVVECWNDSFLFVNTIEELMDITNKWQRNRSRGQVTSPLILSDDQNSKDGGD